MSFNKSNNRVFIAVCGWTHLYLHILMLKGCYGEICKLFQNNTSEVTHGLIINCPRPEDHFSLTACCALTSMRGVSSNFNNTCCVADGTSGTGLSSGAKVGIAFAVILSVILISMAVLCLLCKYSKWWKKSSLEAYTPRFKVKINGKRQNVGPADKKTLLKTANYTVEKSWDQVVIKFHHQAFFDQFVSLLTSRYKELNWEPKEPKIGNVKCSEGIPICLRVIDESKFVIVTDEGNITWVMNDFQNICKNIQISDNNDRTKEMLPKRSHPLLPRLPTIDEQHYTADDYSVRISQTEVDVKFYSQYKFDNFKRAVLLKYPTVPWSKYLQRDCAQIKLEGGKRVTLHLWEEIRSIWLSGDGRTDWYHNQFEELFQQANDVTFIDSFNVRPLSGRSKRSMSLATQASLASEKSQKSYKDVTTLYTVKTLDTGGFELEFPNNELIGLFKVLLKVKYPQLIWKEYSCRHIAKINIEKNKSVSVHISTEGSGQKKIWIYDESKKDWINNDFREIYGMAYSSLYERSEDEHEQEEDNDGLTKVETNL